MGVMQQIDDSIRQIRKDARFDAVTEDVGKPAKAEPPAEDTAKPLPTEQPVAVVGDEGFEPPTPSV